MVGAGRVGTAFAVLLARAGHQVVAASGREASRERTLRFLPQAALLEPAEAASKAEVTILGVPDDLVAGMCQDLAAQGAFSEGDAVVHLSGSVPLLALGGARAAGALVLSAHPLQAFPDVEGAIERLPGSAVAVSAWEEEGFALGERLASDAGTEPFRLADEDRSLYHAAAVFSSNYLVALQGAAEELFAAAGVEEPLRRFGPLAEATMANVLRLGPQAALTGPVARGDVGTVRRNLEALGSRAPWAVAPYVALADVTLRLAGLHDDIRRSIEEVLAEWR